MTQLGAQNNRDAIAEIPDLREILMTIWRHKFLVLTVGLLSMIVCTLFIFTRPREYVASATIKLDERPLNLANFQDVTQTADDTDVAIETEVRMLTSPALAERTVEALGIVGDRAPASAAAGFLSHLTVAPQGISRIIIVSFRAEDPKFAAKAVNAHIDSYMKAQVEFKKERIESLGSWFEAKVRDLKEDVIRKSTAVEEYRAQHNLAVGKDSQELLYAQISDASAQLAPVQTLKDNISSRLQALAGAAKTGNANAVGDIVKSPLIDSLKSQANSTSQLVQSLRSQYGANHPKLVAANSELAQVNSAIAREVANIRAAMKNEYEAAAAQEKMLKDRIAALNKQGDELRKHLVTLGSLQVEQDASEKLLDSFLSNYENIQSQMTFARADAVVVSPATVPTRPASPGKKILLLAALILSSLLALAAVFTVEMMRGGLRNFDDVRKLGQKPIGIMPLTQDPLTIMLQPGSSSFKESIKRIYMAALMEGSARTILVTSALPKEGRTTFTISMARYLQSLGHKVLVIDADFLKPTLGSMAIAKEGPGLKEVLAGTVSLESAITSDDNGVAILRAGGRGALSPDTLRAANLSQLFEQLKLRYAYVLIDSGPLLAHSEAGVIANQADGIIVVAEWTKTSEGNLSNMLATLQYLSAPVLGVVMSKVDLRKYKKVSGDSDFLLPKSMAA